MKALRLPGQQFPCTSPLTDHKDIILTNSLWLDYNINTKRISKETANTSELELDVELDSKETKEKFSLSSVPGTSSISREFVA